MGAFPGVSGNAKPRLWPSFTARGVSAVLARGVTGSGVGVGVPAVGSCGDAHGTGGPPLLLVVKAAERIPD